MSSNFESVVDVLGWGRQPKYAPLATDDTIDNKENGPNEFVYPPKSSLVCRFSKEFSATYFLCFVYGMAATDTQTGQSYLTVGMLTGGAMLLTMTLFKGTAGNPWFTLLNTLFGHPKRSLMYPVCALSLQLSGAVFAFYTVSCLRSGAQALTPALNEPLNGTDNSSFVFVEALFTFVLCYSYNMMHREPSEGGSSLIVTSWAPYISSVILALAYAVGGPLGSGSCNLMKTLGAATIVGNYNGVWQIFVGGLTGTALAAGVFAITYIYPA